MCIYREKKSRAVYKLQPYFTATIFGTMLEVKLTHLREIWFMCNQMCIELLQSIPIFEHETLAAFKAFGLSMMDRLALRQCIHSFVG